MIYTNDMIKQKNAKKRRIKKITNAIYILFGILLVLIISYICYCKLIKKENNIKVLGISQYIVMTGSMEPNYNIGDIVIDKEIKKEEIKVGDVITFSESDGKSVITHRIIDIIEKDGETYYQTKGDNNSSPDQDLVSYNQIQVKAIYKLDKIGLVLRSFTTGTGIIILALIIILGYMKSDRKEKKRIKRENDRKEHNIPKYKKGVT